MIEVKTQTLSSMTEHIIFQSSSDEGVIEISQNQNTRSLYFGNDAKQSCMDIFQPNRLVLSYTRAMMASLIFQPQPQKILIIGLGGGSIAKFLLRHYPSCSVDIVEIREDVVKIAHDYFSLPKDERMQIFVDDASRFLRNQNGRHQQYDLILIDAFDHDGVSESIKSFEFFEYCFERLDGSGTIATNLWNSKNDHACEINQMMEHIFSKNILNLPVPDRGNIIVFTAKDKRTLQLSNTYNIANNLEQSQELEYKNFLQQIKRANRWRKLGSLFV